MYKCEKHEKSSPRLAWRWAQWGQAGIGAYGEWCRERLSHEQADKLAAELRLAGQARCGCLVG